MKLNPYLMFDGDCAEAFRFYEKALGGKIESLQTHGDSPAREHVSADWHDKVLHAELRVGEQPVMGSDAPPGYYQKPQGFGVTLVFDDVAAGEKVFNALADGGHVTMPFEKTFWADAFGMVVDRFGTPWMINCGNTDC